MLYDICEECKSIIYPDDEKVSIGLSLYHFECAPDEDDSSVKDGE